MVTKTKTEAIDLEELVAQTTSECLSKSEFFHEGAIQSRGDRLYWSDMFEIRPNPSGWKPYLKRNEAMVTMHVNGVVSLDKEGNPTFSPTESSTGNFQECQDAQKYYAALKKALGKQNATIRPYGMGSALVHKNPIRSEMLLHFLVYRK